MIQGDEKAYYADKAYDSRALRGKLAEMGIEDRIAYKAKRNKPWSTGRFGSTRRLRAFGGRRARQRHDEELVRMARVRYRGLARNHCHLQFVAMAMNMKRARVLLARRESRPTGDVRQEVEKRGQMSG